VAAVRAAQVINRRKEAQKTHNRQKDFGSWALARRPVTKNNTQQQQTKT
jgi:hypothetical protein